MMTMNYTHSNPGIYYMSNKSYLNNISVDPRQTLLHTYLQMGARLSAHLQRQKTRKATRKQRHQQMMAQNADDDHDVLVGQPQFLNVDGVNHQILHVSYE